MSNLQKITFSAPAEQIELARQLALDRGTTLESEILLWLESMAADTNK